NDPREHKLRRETPGGQPRLEGMPPVSCLCGPVNVPRESGQPRDALATSPRTASFQGGDKAMRKLLCTLMLGMTLSSSVGCIIPIYSADPVRRTRKLIFTSEELRSILDTWERIWFLDQPSHFKPFRTHGGII